MYLCFKISWFQAKNLMKILTAGSAATICITDSPVLLLRKCPSGYKCETGYALKVSPVHQQPHLRPTPRTLHHRINKTNKKWFSSKKRELKIDWKWRRNTVGKYVTWATHTTPFREPVVRGVMMISCLCELLSSTWTVFTNTGCLLIWNVGGGIGRTWH